MNNSTPESGMIGVDPHRFVTMTLLAILMSFLIIGNLGNVFSSVIFLRQPLRRQSSNVYLFLMCVSDWLFMLSELLTAVEIYMDHSLYQTSSSCQFTYFLLHWSATLSPWALSAFTIERCLVVCRPFKRLCLRASIARRIAMGLAIVSSVLCFPLIPLVDVVHKENRYTCTLQDSNALRVIMKIDFVMSFVIPTLIIVSLNAVIITKTVTSSRWNLYARNHSTQNAGMGVTVGQRTKLGVIPRESRNRWADLKKSVSRLRKSNQRTVSGINGHTDLSLKLSKRQTRYDFRSKTLSLESAQFKRGQQRSRPIRAFYPQMMIILFVLSTVYAIFNVPFHMLGGLNVQMPIVAQKLAFILYCAQFSFNIIIYSCIHRRFRSEAKKLLTQLTKPCDQTRTLSSRIAKPNALLRPINTLTPIATKSRLLQEDPPVSKIRTMRSNSI